MTPLCSPLSPPPHFGIATLTPCPYLVQIDDGMMSELRAVQEAVKPSDTLLVVDSMTGQEAAGLVKAFNEAAPLTGTSSLSPFRFFCHPRHNTSRTRQQGWWIAGEQSRFDVIIRQKWVQDIVALPSTKLSQSKVQYLCAEGKFKFVSVDGCHITEQK